MEIIWIVLSGLAFLALLARLATDLIRDGYGEQPGPRSHRSWTLGHLGSTPPGSCGG